MVGEEGVGPEEGVSRSMPVDGTFSYPQYGGKVVATKIH